MGQVTLISAVLGALAAVGVLILVRELLPAAPPLGAALRRLHPDQVPVRPTTGSITDRAVRLWPVPYESLALLGRSTRQYYLSLLAAGLGGLALPAVAGFLLVASGRGVPSVLLAAGGLVSLGSGVVFVYAAHRDVEFRAKRARAEFRSAVAVFLSLVAMERAAGHGSVESLERAAQVSDGWVFLRIREALLRARSHHRPPWDELSALAASIGVPELGDVGQIMHSSGQSGAQVHRTLLERADSLRDEIRAEALARAEATTGKLEIPGAVLLVVLAAFVIYPITQRVFG